MFTHRLIYMVLVVFNVNVRGKKFPFLSLTSSHSIARCCNRRVFLPHFAQSISLLEFEGRGSSLLILPHQFTLEFEVSDMFERNFYEPATVALCKIELCEQFKIGILILYHL